MKKLLHLAMLVFVGGCSSLPVCDKTVINEDVLVDTAKGFLSERFGDDSDALMYEVREADCGYTVTAFPRPNELDSDIFILINSKGVYRAFAPSGVFFDTRGDHFYNEAPDKPYPLVRKVK